MKAQLVRWLFCGVILLCSGCGGGLVPPGCEPGPAGPSWPPPAGGRRASGCQTDIPGTEYTVSGGLLEADGSGLVFRGGGDLPWAVYSLDGIKAGNDLQSVGADFTLTQQSPGSATKLYFGIANYRLNAWEWLDTPAPSLSWSVPAGAGGDYRSEEGVVSLAVALGGPGTGRLATVSFSHGEDPGGLAAPDGLSADTPVPNRVDLSWEAVADAEGYNVYRSTAADFSSRVKLNPAPVVSAAFTDDVATDGNFYYYGVAAVAGEESALSDPVRVWIHGDDLPAPANLRVTESSPDGFKLEWDWEDPVGGDPYGFALFIDTVPGFDLGSTSMVKHTTFGASRGNTFHDLDPGGVYYCRVCAYDGFSSPYGRISEECEGRCAGVWTWGDFEVVDTGRPPLRITAGNGLPAASYFKGTAIYFTIDEGEGWRSEPALEEDDQVFFDYQDLCFDGGTFLVTTQAPDPGDCWVADWSYGDAPGAWDEFRVHGDGVCSLGSEMSGYFVTCAGGGGELAVMHLLIGENKLVLHTRSSAGGDWDTVKLDGSFGSDSGPTYTLCYHDSNLYATQASAFVTGILFGDRAAGWSWQNIVPSPPVKVAQYHDLQWFRDEFWSPGYSSTENCMYFLHGTSAPWVFERCDGDVESGRYTRMAVAGDDAAVIQYKDNRYYFGMYSEGWDWRPISIPGVSEYSEGADVCLIAGIPWVVLHDGDTQEIVIARGTPPE